MFGTRETNVAYSQDQEHFTWMSLLDFFFPFSQHGWSP